MPTHAHALLIVLALLSGCVATDPAAKPSVPTGVTAPDPKPANGAQAAASEAAQDRLSKLSPSLVDYKSQ